MPDVLSRPLWRSFLFVLLVSLLILSLGTYFLWQSILDEEKTKLIYSNKIVSNSMQTVLNKNEALLKVMGKRLQEVGLFSEPKASLLLINELLQENPELAGVGIADINGQLRITSSNMSQDNLPNLLNKNETVDSFVAALKTDILVMGRTYFMKSLKQWVVPLRYRITNSEGQVVALLTTGLKLEDENSPWQSEIVNPGMRLSIINSDFYFQYASFFNAEELYNIYNQPIDQRYLDLFASYLFKQTGLSFSDFLESRHGVVTLIYPRPDGTKSISAFSYNKKYKLFTFTINNFSSLYIKILVPLVTLFSLLFAFNIILFFLFKKQNKLQQRFKKDLEYQAQHDHLTGLPNLRYLKSHFQKWQEKCNSYSVVFIDLDNFKNSNDLHGHAIGDKILCEVAWRIKRFFKECIWIRQGGDEFIIITPANYFKTIENTCYEFLNVLKQTISIESLEFSIRASIGVASSPSDGTNIESLFRKADIAMYEAKKNRTGVHIFSHKLDIDNSRASLVSKELNSALERNEMYILYQPQIDLKTNKIIGVEALLRWNNKLLGQVPPDEFIPIAESTGVILDIGNFVFETSLREFQDTCKSIYSNIDDTLHVDGKLRLSINISIRQLSEEKFSESLFSMVRQYDCKHTKLMLEITETMTINRIDEIGLTLNKIQQAGIGVSLDDFGTGHSSLSHLSKLPIDEIKIDKSFIQEIPNNKQDIVLIKSIINLGKSLNIKVLAEGVESIKQVNFLNRLGCQYFQGFYYSHPVDQQSLKKLMKTKLK